METGRYSSSQDLQTGKHKKPHLLGELVTGRTAQKSTNGGQCWQICFSSDEKKLAWSAGFGEVVVLPWQEYKTCLEEKEGLDACLSSQVVIKSHVPVTSLAFGSPQLSYGSHGDDAPLLLATGHVNGRIRISNPETGELILELSDHRKAVRCLAFSPHNSLLVSGSEDGTIKVWDMSDGGNMVKTLKEHRTSVRALAWAPNDNILCSVGNKQKVVLWDMDDLTLCRRFSGHFNDVTDCCFSPDGALLATASNDTRAIVWCTATGEKVKELQHEFPTPGIIYMSGANSTGVTGVSFANSSHKLSTVCSDGKIRFWDLYSDNFTESLDGLESSPKDDSMLCCSHSPQGGILAVGYASGNALIYSTSCEVPTLLQLSRMSVRRSCPLNMNDGEYEALNLPSTLQPYLKYQYWH